MVFSEADLKEVKSAINEQKVSGAFEKTKDDKFPIYGLELEKNHLVYIPRTMVKVNNDGSEVFEPVKMHGHMVLDGKFKSVHRCINGLNHEMFKERLEYDGECPYCNASQECWDLYNLKLENVARQKDVDPKNDEAGVLTEDKRKFAEERAIEGAESYVAFPIVVIPNINNTVKVDKEAVGGAKAYYVIWKEKQYKDRILSCLDSYEDKEHMGGMFMLWSYVYDTGGKQANKMQAGKNAKYTVIPTQDTYAKYIDTLEGIASEFTEDKAYEVLVQYEFDTKAAIDSKVDKVMRNTRALIEMLGGTEKEEGTALEAAEVLSEFNNAEEADEAKKGLMPEDGLINIG